MRIYHPCNVSSEIFNDFKNKRKNMKKKYKSIGKPKDGVNREKASAAIGGQERKSKKLMKIITKKNIRFLEGLGLKVKQSIENC